MSLHYDGDNNYLFVNGKEIYKFKASNENINFPSQFFLGNISNKYDYVDSEEVSLKGNVYNCSVNYDAIDKFNILNVHKYLRTAYKMFGIIKKLFIVLLTGIANASNHTKCISLHNQKCEIQPTFINLHPNNRVCVPNKTEKLNIHVFNMITGKN